MKSKELEHLIRAASAITDQYEIMIVGSQSILGAVPEATTLRAHIALLPIPASHKEKLYRWIEAHA